MINYIYDGTFEGLLTVLAGTMKNHEEINDISSWAQPDLFTEIRVVETDPRMAGCFFKKLDTELSRNILMDIVFCYLSEEPGIEKVILDYIRLLLANSGRVSVMRISKNYADQTVYKIRRLCDKVSHEIHRLHGFVRFRKLIGGIYYAPIEPDYNVLQYLAPHFKERFADQKWLIHDVKRQTGIYYNGIWCSFLPVVELSPLLQSASLHPYQAEQAESFFDPEEMDYQKLWDQYFQQIAISERRNERLQKQRMPVRYWRYLVENA